VGNVHIIKCFICTDKIGRAPLVKLLVNRQGDFYAALHHQRRRDIESEFEMDWIAHLRFCSGVSEMWKKIRESTDIAWIKEWRDKSDPTSPNWHVAQQRLAELMQSQALQTLRRPWYRTRARLDRVFDAARSDRGARCGDLEMSTSETVDTFTT
jgi:hypothetical protein